MKKITLLIFLTPLIFMACLSNHWNDEKLCTEIYVFIQITVKDSLNNPVILDNFEVKNVKSNQLLPVHKDSASASEGRYVLITDSELRLISENGTSLRFSGFKNTAPIITGDYIVNQDGCHINLLSGQTDLIVE